MEESDQSASLPLLFAIARVCVCVFERKRESMRVQEGEQEKGVQERVRREREWESAQEGPRQNRHTQAQRNMVAISGANDDGFKLCAPSPRTQSILQRKKGSLVLFLYQMDGRGLNTPWSGW